MRDIAPQIKDKLYYQIPQLQDTATYYVRAVVKDLVSGTVLGTYNLDSLGNQAFSKDWTTPSDNTGGNGRTLVVTFTVYENSSYTTPSANYGASAEYFRVIQPWNIMASGGGSGFVSGFKNEDISKPIIDGYEKHKKEITDENKVHKEELSKVISDFRTEILGYLNEIKDAHNKTNDDVASKIESISQTSSKMEKLHGHAISSLNDVINSNVKDKENQKREIEANLSDHKKKMEGIFSSVVLKDAKEELKNDFNTQINAFFNLMEGRLSKMEEKLASTDFESHAEKTAKKTTDMFKKMFSDGSGTPEEKKNPKIGLRDILNI